MSNIPTVTVCPKCMTAGQQIKDYGRVVHMQCPKCKTEWSTVKVGGKSS